MYIVCVSISSNPYQLMRHLTLSIRRQLLLLRLLHLTAKAVQSASLALQGVDYVHGGYGLALGVLGVSDSITNDVFQEHLIESTGY